MISRIKNTIFERGFLLTLLLSLTTLFFFFGELIKHLSWIYFGASGDGLQAYYGTIFHVKYDASYWRMDGMNYPYGEQVFYTGCQPFVANALKFLNTFFDTSDCIVGTLNGIMLFSIVVCALVIYLIFKHLKLSPYYSAIAATAITFLSPQIDRLGGHYSLTYQFAIPLFLLLLFRFKETPTIRKSFWISAYIFFIAGTHFYFYAIFAFVSVFYWLGLYFFNEKINRSWKSVLTHFFIQIILPYLVIQLIIVLTDSAFDRTSFPYGYLQYISNPTGVFFQQGRFYTPIVEMFFEPVFPEWEGFSYVGIVSVLVCLFILLYILKNILFRNMKGLLKIAKENYLLLFFLFASIGALLLAFGYPFKIQKLEFLLMYSGPLKQLRGIGRFTWVFYYVINIISFYMLARLKISDYFRYSLMGIAVTLVCYDAYGMSRNRQQGLDNEIEALEDTQNQLLENQWINQLNTSDYQAIISLPYTHIGSENIWVYKESPILKYTFIASLKTGLKLVPVCMSRTSLHQTYNNIQIIKEPYRKLEIVNDFKNDKPFLVMAREEEMDEEEKNFLEHCQFLKKTPAYALYELKVETLQQLSRGLYEKTKLKRDTAHVHVMDGFKSTDSLKTFVYEGFENLENSNAFVGKGCYEGVLKDYNVIYKGVLPNWQDKEYVLSLWMDDFSTDLYPRSRVELAFSDSTGSVYGSDNFEAGKNFSLMNDKWALIEHKFKLKNKKDQLTITIWSDVIKNSRKQLRVDELLIRPVSTDVYWNLELTEKITINNRTYLKSER